MNTRYTAVAIGLHWLIAGLIIAVLAMGFVMSSKDILPQAQRFAMYQWHKSIGITILLLSVFRLYWRATHQPPPMPADMKTLQRFAAKAVHVAFYVLMIGMPLLGWVIVSASSLGIPTMLYGLVHWPHLPMPASPETKEMIGEAAEELHESGAWLLLACLALHVGAALYHHYVQRDGLLRRMIPWVR